MTTTSEIVLTEVIDAEIVETDVALSAEQARKLTDEIKAHLSIGYGLIAEAYEGRAWVALGYETWDAYCAAEFAEARMVRLDPEQRQQIVAELHGAGMSTRAIASGVRVSKNTVTKDVSQIGTPATARTGTDGKTYPAPAPSPSKRNRSPLPKAWRATLWELDRVARRLDKLSKDDRVRSNDLPTGQLEGIKDMLAEIVARLDGGAS